MTSGAKPAASLRALLFGAGRMGGALAKGWRANMRAAGLKSLDIIDPAPSQAMIDLAEDRRIRLNARPRPADVIVIAVKPQGFQTSAPTLQPWLTPQSLIVSVMAGIPITAIAKTTGASRVIRTMPNLPGSIGQGVTAFAASKSCDAEAARQAEALLAPLGEVVGPMDENLLDAVTAVSGGGPAYVSLLSETMEAAARAQGLDAATAAILVRKTIIGAAAMLEQGEDPAELRRAVTSPGGTTAAALDVLMAPGAMSEMFRKAIEAAVERARALGKQ